MADERLMVVGDDGYPVPGGGVHIIDGGHDGVHVMDHPDGGVHVVDDMGGGVHVVDNPGDVHVVDHPGDVHVVDGDYGGGHMYGDPGMARQGETDAVE